MYITHMIGIKTMCYEPIAAKYHNIDEYPYYPYMPQGGEAPNRNGRILVGTSLVPDDYHTYPD
jgi:hypothetical protein